MNNKLKHKGAIRTRFSDFTVPVCCVLLNHNASAFLNRKALPTNTVKTEKSSTLNAEILSFIKAEDADGLVPVKDDNTEKGQKNKFKACSYDSPMLKIWELSLLIALCVSFCLGTWAQARQTDISSGLTRLHVIAHSDSEYEQALKLRVRDAVLKYLEPKLKGAATSDDAERIIRAEYNGITAAAAAVSEGRRISVTLGREYYPTRCYEGFSLPAGEYNSLRVIIGDGAGHNWWCVVFPPLCVSAAECDEAVSTMDGDVREIISSDGGCTVKFRIVELWGELMSFLGM